MKRFVVFLDCTHEDRNKGDVLSTNLAIGMFGNVREKRGSYP